MKISYFSIFFLFTLVLIIFGNNLYSQDSLKVKNDSLFYQNLKQKANRSKLGGILYDLFIIDDSTRLAREKLNYHNFDTFENRIIRHIGITVLEVFGPSLKNPLGKPSNVFEKFGNSIHVTTLEFIIQNNILLKPSEIFDARQAAESERILRTLPFIYDARIIPKPVGEDSVDILVLSQDSWSLVPEIVLDPIKPAATLKFSENNFLGTGQTFTFLYAFSNDSSFFHRSNISYTVPNIKGTFINGTINSVFNENKESISLNLDRKFLTQSTRYAGEFTLGYNNLLTDIWQNNHITERRFLQSSELDGWIGYATAIPNFLFPTISKSIRKRTRLVSTIRYNRFTPFTDENRVSYYQKSHLIMGEAGLVYRNFYRENFVFESGPTEDIPEGLSVKLGYGLKLGKSVPQVYLGGTSSFGKHYENIGYINLVAGIGQFFTKDQTFSGVFKCDAFFFTDKFRSKNWIFRQFVGLHYLAGLSIAGDRFITLNEPNGLTGLDNKFFKGKDKLYLTIRNLTVTPFNLLGFRLSVNTFWDMGLMSITKKNLDIFKSPLYHTFGLGIAVRNDRIFFQSLEFSVVMYRNFPVVTPVSVDNYDFIFDLTQPQNLDRFGFNKPAPIPYE